MKNNYKKGISSTILLLIVAIIATAGLYLWSVNSNQSSKIVDKKVVVSKKIDTTSSDVVPVNNSVPSYDSNLPAGLIKAFSLFKNGSIDECTLNGETYYSGGINAYDGGSEVIDVKGNIVGECRGITGLCTGVLPQKCDRVYVVSPNIWGYPAINKYNLR